MTTSIPAVPPPPPPPGPPAAAARLAPVPPPPPGSVVPVPAVPVPVVPVPVVPAPAASSEGRTRALLAAFSPTYDLARRVAALLLLLACVGLVGAVLEMLQMGLVGRALLVTSEEIAGNDSRMAIYGWIQLAVGGAAGAAVLVWLGKARRNAVALGSPKPGLGPALPEALAHSAEPGARAPWWAPVLVWSVAAAAGAGLLARGLAVTATSAGRLQLASALFLLADLATVVAAWFGARFVRRVATGQDARALEARYELEPPPSYV